MATRDEAAARLRREQEARAFRQDVAYWTVVVAIVLTTLVTVWWK